MRVLPILLALTFGVATAVLARAQPKVDEKNKGTTLDKNEAKKAFEYLNMVRVKPSAFSKEIGADLSNVKASPELKWNAILAKVAESKVLDMVKRDYFDHVTPEGLSINVLMHEAGYTLPQEWIKDKKVNFFESLDRTKPSGTDMIKSLIRDEGIQDLSHRKHLLALDEWRAKHKDVGIGFAQNPNSKYRTYICVIIAHQ